MGRGCDIKGCQRGFLNGTFHGFEFNCKKHELFNVWKSFINNSAWDFKNSLICYEHFEEKYVNRGQRWRLNWDMSPIPTLFPPTFNSICLREANPVLCYNSAATKELRNELFESLTSVDAPDDFHYSRNESHVVYYNLNFDAVTGFPCVLEAIKIDEKLRVQLQYKNCPISLPSWIRKRKNKNLSCVSEIQNLVDHIRFETKTEHGSMSIVEEIQKNMYTDMKGRPPYSAEMIRFALLLRHTSRQAYSKLLEVFPLPSFSLLQKIQQGGIDSLKALKRLHDMGKISTDIVLMVDEMFLDKCSQYESGKYVGQDAEGTLYKGIVTFMVVGLKQSIPFVVKAVPEVTISGKWLAGEIDG